MKNFTHDEIDRLADEIREGDNLENLDILVDALKALYPEFPVGTLVDIPQDADQITLRADGKWHWVGLGRVAYLDDENVRSLIRDGHGSVVPR